ncbi:DUF636 domain protein [Ampelomyces quisqualis]|uniref:DUF636 domain protein n=1 Tax=Ampelomyces quisqualis TaxID=50730 RepID=A0A6A5QHR6_AMPQU|nr:DUF636 domain protein [Ampelomyces quisqualis]
MSSSIFTGSCLCSTIRYTIRGEPTIAVMCHCSNCKKTSGSAFQANLLFKHEQLTFLSGELKLTDCLDTTTASGSTRTRSFCSVCGSNVLATNESSPYVRGYVIIMTGCLDGDFTFEPSVEYFCKDRCV